MEKAVVLFGTETGNAEDLADDLSATLEECGMEAEVLDMEDADPGVLDGSRAVVICTATHGDGDLPDNSVDFYEALVEERPDLSGVVFAVCGLGDSVYPDFCEAGRTWSRTLAEFGAREVVERYEIDAGPEEEDIEGACEWVEQAAERFRELVPR
jgi:MioC protein